MEYQKTETKELIRVLFQQWKLIAGTTFLITAIALVISLMIKVEFKSTANLIPSETKSIGLGMLGSGGLGSLAGSLLGQKDDRFDRFYVILTSETVQELVIEKFDLIKAYDLQNDEHPLLETKKELANMTAFEGLFEGNFVIEVWDKNPNRAKEMAEFYVEQLNEKNTELSIREAKDYREFIEKRYQKAQVDLDSLLAKNRRYQRKYGIYSIESQVSAMFTSIGKVIQDRVQADLQYEYLKSSSSANFSIVQKKKQERDFYDKQLDDFRTRAATNGMFPGLDELPDAVTEFVELEIELEIQRNIQQFIVPLYEQALLEEAKSIPAVTVVDQPRVSTKKDRPKRAIIVLAAFFSAIILMSYGIIFNYVYQKNTAYYRYLMGQ